MWVAVLADADVPLRDCARLSEIRDKVDGVSILRITGQPTKLNVLERMSHYFIEIE